MFIWSNKLISLNFNFSSCPAPHTLSLERVTFEVRGSLSIFEGETLCWEKSQKVSFKDKKYNLILKRIKLVLKWCKMLNIRKL